MFAFMPTRIKIGWLNLLHFSIEERYMQCGFLLIHISVPTINQEIKSDSFNGNVRQYRNSQLAVILTTGLQKSFLQYTAFCSFQRKSCVSKYFKQVIFLHLWNQPSIDIYSRNCILDVNYEICVIPFWIMIPIMAP